MRNILLIIVGLIVLVAVAWFGSRALEGVFNTSRNITPVPTGPIARVTPTGVIVTSRVVTPTPIVVQDNSQNITVSSPLANSRVSSPFMVQGSARVFENVVLIELTDSNGIVLYSGSAYANAADVGLFGNFQQQVQFVTNSPTGLLTVYQASPRDGSRVDIVEVPLNFN